MNHSRYAVIGFLFLTSCIPRVSAPGTSVVQSSAAVSSASSSSIFFSFSSSSSMSVHSQRDWRNFSKPSDAELQSELTPLEYDVTQHDGTERPFDNMYWNNHADGIYVDIVSGEPLFSSKDKYDSGTGWPSFTKPLDSANIVEQTDTSLAMDRTEVRSRHGDSHLGHVFPDGPKPTGLRFCMNSAALRFIPKEKLSEEGYGEYMKLFQ